MYLDTDAPITLGGGSNNCGNGMWGDNAWWIVILLIFGWGAWGGNGFGGGNGGGTNADLQRGFDTQAITNKLNGIENGICDSTFALNNSINGIQQTLCQGFSGVNSAIYQNGTDTRFAINDLGYKLQDCCCQTQRAIDGVNYNMARNTCDIIQAQNAGVQRIVDFLTSEKISSLQAENQTLKFQASQSAQNAFISANQEAQTAELIRRLGRDCPVPAFVVPNPNCCYQNTTYQNSGCCGCNNY